MGCGIYRYCCNTFLLGLWDMARHVCLLHSFPFDNTVVVVVVAGPRRRRRKKRTV